MGPRRSLASCPAPPRGASRDKAGKGKRAREGADRLGPAWQRDKAVWVGGRWAGWACWAEGHGGLRLGEPKKGFGVVQRT
jgi:hypothetical protein